MEMVDEGAYWEADTGIGLNTGVETRDGLRIE
jgi:hypothetical protein